jgi:hypothetical protein
MVAPADYGDPSRRKIRRRFATTILRSREPARFREKRLHCPTLARQLLTIGWREAEWIKKLHTTVLMAVASDGRSERRLFSLFPRRLAKNEGDAAGKLGVCHLFSFDRLALLATDSDAGHARVNVRGGVPCNGAGFVKVAGFVIEAHSFEQDLDGSFAGKSGLLGDFTRSFCYGAFRPSSTLSTSTFCHCSDFL